MSPEPPSTIPTAPAIKRRMASFVYEGVLLFGVVMIAGYLFSSLTQQRHALHGQWGLRAFLFLVLAIYFVGFWSRGGQTVAMKTWHLRLVARDGSPVSQPRALARYLASWVWFVPALALAEAGGVRSGLGVSAIILGGVVVYALSARLRADGQFWHDALCGTRVVHWKPPPR